MVVGLLVFLWVGFELSYGAAEEMKNPQRDVPRMIFSSGVICALVYGGGFLIITLVRLDLRAGDLPCYQRSAGEFFLHNAFTDRFHYGGMAGAWVATIITEAIVTAAVPESRRARNPAQPICV